MYLKMKKIMLVFGTRPEAIKMAPLVKAFQARKDEFETIVCVTGQHREMLDQVLSLFDIKPDFDLNIMKQGQDLYDVTSRVLLGMRDVFKTCVPDILFVHGDTTTSTAAALAAFYHQIPVAHVEAGLRTGNIYSPWPEEMNRLITGRIATYNLSPTKLSRENLLRENVSDSKIVVTGNTVIDALHWVTNKINNDKILVIYDDMDIEPGKIKIRKKGSAGGHNGMKSIIQMIGTEEFPRIRVGIGRPIHKGDEINYVIGAIPEEEQKKLDEGTEKAQNAIVEILKNGVDSAMNKYN